MAVAWRDATAGTEVPLPEALRGLAAEWSENAGELAEVIAERLDADIGELSTGGDEQAYDELRRSVLGNLTTLFGVLAAGRLPEGTDAPLAALEYARGIVRRGISLAALLRAYRLGHGLAWDRWAQAATERLEPEDLSPALETSSRLMFRYIDVVSDRMVEEYDAERERWVRSAAAARADAARAILDRRLVDVDAASRVLGYELKRHHLGLVVWSEDEPTGGFGQLERAATSLMECAPFSDSLLIPMGNQVLWAWLGTREPPADGALDSLQVPRLPRHIRVAAGEPGAGPDGFRRSHEEALQAHRVASVAGRPTRAFTRYRSIEVESLLSGDLARARRFVTRELGRLAGRDDSTVRLRATVQIFLKEGASNLRTARRLGIHQNTVVYRIRRAEELLGHPISERRLALEVALLLAETLAGAVLPTEVEAND